MHIGTSSSLLKSHPVISRGPWGGLSLHFNHSLSGSPGSCSKLRTPLGEGFYSCWCQALLGPPGPLGRPCRTSVQGGAGSGSVYTAAGDCGAGASVCSSLPRLFGNGRFSLQLLSRPNPRAGKDAGIISGLAKRKNVNWLHLAQRNFGSGSRMASAAERGGPGVPNCPGFLSGTITPFGLFQDARGKSDSSAMRH